MRVKMSGAIVGTAAGIAAAVLVSLGVSATAGEERTREVPASAASPSASEAVASTTRTAPPTDESALAVESAAAASESADSGEASAGAAGVATPDERATASLKPTTPSAENTAPNDATTPRQRWLAQQELVRECMNDQGFDYLYYEWWNPEYQREDFSSPAMPEDLTAEEKAAWNFALDGETGGGVDYHWEDAGCWGKVVHELGITS